MNKTLFTTFMIFGLFVGSQSQAAIKIVGSGGDAFECRIDGAIKYFTLDAFEGAKRFSGSPDYKNLQGDHLKRAETLALRLAKHNPQLASMLIQKIKDFPKLITWITDAEMEDVRDSNHLFEPEGDCRMIQAAVQTAETERYYINHSLWEKFDPNQKAELVLHELIFRLYLDSNSALDRSDSLSADELYRYQLDSLATRELVWFLISDSIREMSTREWWRWMYQNRFFLWAELPGRDGFYKLTSYQLAPNFLIRFDEDGFFKELIGTANKSLYSHGDGRLGLGVVDPRFYPEFGASKQTTSRPFQPLAQDPQVHEGQEPRDPVLTLKASKCLSDTSKNKISLSGKSAYEFAKSVLKSMRRFSPAYEDVLLKQLNELHSKITMISGVKFTADMNEDSMDLDKNCTTAQVMKLETRLNPYDNNEFVLKSALINKKEWERLSISQQGLLLAQAVLSAHTTWPRTRPHSLNIAESAKRWVQLLASKDFEKMSDREYLKAVVANRWLFSLSYLHFFEPKYYSPNCDEKPCHRANPQWRFDNQGRILSVSLTGAGRPTHPTMQKPSIQITHPLFENRLFFANYSIRNVILKENEVIAIEFYDPSEGLSQNHSPYKQVTLFRDGSALLETSASIGLPLTKDLKVQLPDMYPAVIDGENCLYHGPQLHVSKDGKLLNADQLNKVACEISLSNPLLQTWTPLYGKDAMKQLMDHKFYLAPLNADQVRNPSCLKDTCYALFYYPSGGELLKKQSYALSADLTIAMELEFNTPMHRFYFPMKMMPIQTGAKYQPAFIDGRGQPINPYLGENDLDVLEYRSSSFGVEYLLEHAKNPQAQMAWAYSPVAYTLPMDHDRHPKFLSKNVPFTWAGELVHPNGSLKNIMNAGFRSGSTVRPWNISFGESEVYELLGLWFKFSEDGRVIHAEKGRTKKIAADF